MRRPVNQTLRAYLYVMRLRSWEMNTVGYSWYARSSRCGSWGVGLRYEFVDTLPNIVVPLPAK